MIQKLNQPFAEQLTRGQWLACDFEEPTEYEWFAHAINAQFEGGFRVASVVCGDGPIPFEVVGTTGMNGVKWKANRVDVTTKAIEGRGKMLVAYFAVEGMA